jgi:hypothetical protein
MRQKELKEIKKIIREVITENANNKRNNSLRRLVKALISEQAAPVAAARPGSEAKPRINPRTAEVESLATYILDARQPIGSNAPFRRLANLLVRNNEAMIPRALQFAAPVARGVLVTRLPRLLALLAPNTPAITPNNQAIDFVINNIKPVFEEAARIRIPASIAEIPPNSPQRRQLASRLLNISNRLQALLPQFLAIVNAGPFGNESLDDLQNLDDLNAELDATAPAAPTEPGSLGGSPTPSTTEEPPESTGDEPPAAPPAPSATPAAPIPPAPSLPPYMRGGMTTTRVNPDGTITTDPEIRRRAAEAGSMPSTGVRENVTLGEGLRLLRLKGRRGY